MDSLEAFEKALATEREERQREGGHTHRKHKHRHRNDPDREKGRGRHGVHDRDHYHRHDRDARRNRDDERDIGQDGEYHRHHHRSRRHQDDVNEDRHRDKRSRLSRDGQDDDRGSRHHRRHARDIDSRPMHQKHGDPKEDLPLPDEEVSRDDISKIDNGPLVRDSWMTTPSGIDIDYVQRPTKESKLHTAPKDATPEADSSYLLRMSPEKRTDTASVVDYAFGDYGSQWRMKKLDAVYKTATETGRSVEDVVLAQYGGLEIFDEAREEKEDLERRAIYGEGWVGKKKPTGHLHQERCGSKVELAERATKPEQGVVIPDETPAPAIPVDQTTLNRMRAKMMRAKLRRDPDAAKLEVEYNEAAAVVASCGLPNIVVLGVMDSRQLAGTRGEVKAVDTRRGRDRGIVEENTDMSIDDMVREERRTKGQAGGEGARLAQRIAKDGKFENDLEYMNENAEKLARRVHQSDFNLKNVAVNEFQKLSRTLETCPLCHHDEESPPKPPAAPVVSLATRTYLTIPTAPELSPFGAVIVPMQHRTNLLECDDDEWEEIRNFMKSVIRMHHDLGRDVVFYENAAVPRRRRHAAMVAVSIPYEVGAMVPAYFREAMLTADDEWSQHIKVLDTAKAARDGMGRMAFRRSIAKEMPYFHAWFSLDGGLGHIVENESRWPRGDRFAREIFGGMMDVDVDIINKEGRWRRGEDARRVEEFQRRWRKFDWTRALAE